MYSEGVRAGLWGCVFTEGSPWAANSVGGFPDSLDFDSV